MRNVAFEYRSGGQPAGEPDGAGADLKAVVAAAFGLAPDALKKHRGRGPADVAFARQVAMYLAHTRLRLPYVAVGRLFDRDRTTARHACSLVEERREDPRVDSILDYLERAIDLLATGDRGCEA